MKIQLLPDLYTVAKIEDISMANLEDDIVFVGKTDEEVSLVCKSQYVPEDNIAEEGGWRGLKIYGTMDFGVIGVISRISSVLAAEDIPVFVISTFNTDYIFVKDEDLSKALFALEDEYQTTISETECE